MARQHTLGVARLKNLKIRIFLLVAFREHIFVSVISKFQQKILKTQFARITNMWNFAMLRAEYLKKQKYSRDEVSTAEIAVIF